MELVIGQLGADVWMRCFLIGRNQLLIFPDNGPDWDLTSGWRPCPLCDYLEEIEENSSGQPAEATTRRDRLLERPTVETMETTGLGPPSHQSVHFSTV
jgi:hypothetical protein